VTGFVPEGQRDRSQARSARAGVWTFRRAETPGTTSLPYLDRTQTIGRKGTEYEGEFEDEYDSGTKRI
jgi:hypothetical protein